MSRASARSSSNLHGQRWRAFSGMGRCPTRVHACALVCGGRRGSMYRHASRSMHVGESSWGLDPMAPPVPEVAGGADAVAILDGGQHAIESAAPHKVVPVGIDVARILVHCVTDVSAQAFAWQRIGTASQALPHLRWQCRSGISVLPRCRQEPHCSTSQVIFWAWLSPFCAAMIVASATTPSCLQPDPTTQITPLPAMRASKATKVSHILSGQFNTREELYCGNEGGLAV